MIHDDEEIERLRRGWLDQAARDAVEIVRLEVDLAEALALAEAARAMLAALKGVVRVADRKTDEFDAARAAIAQAEAAGITTGEDE
jgi:redox-sensitive bicupin YhaK (pirin superfamily)